LSSTFDAPEAAPETLIVPLTVAPEAGLEIATERERLLIVTVLLAHTCVPVELVARAVSVWLPLA